MDENYENKTYISQGDSRSYSERMPLKNGRNYLKSDFWAVQISSEDSSLLKKLSEAVFPYFKTGELETNVGVAFKIINDEDCYDDLATRSDDASVKHNDYFVFDLHVQTACVEGKVIIRCEFLKNIIICLMGNHNINCYLKNEELGLYDVNRLLRTINGALMEKSCVRLHGSVISVNGQGIVFSRQRFFRETAFILNLNNRKQDVKFIIKYKFKHYRCPEIINN